MTTASFPGSVKDFGYDRIDEDYIPADDTNGLRAEVVALETAALAGGWLGEPGTWTYVSASSFTVSGPGDRSPYYTKGTRLRWVQGGVTKYGIVVSSSYSGTTLVTTVNIIVNSDYVVTVAAISGNYYSNLDNPRGFPTWFAYSATLTGFSVLPPTVISKYNVCGDKVSVIHSEIGGDGTSNSTGFSVSLPVAVGSGIAIVAPVPFAVNGGIQAMNCCAVLSAGSSIVTMRTTGFSSIWTASGGKRAHFEVFYEW